MHESRDVLKLEFTERVYNNFAFDWWIVSYIFKVDYPK